MVKVLRVTLAHLERLRGLEMGITAMVGVHLCFSTSLVSHLRLLLLLLCLRLLLLLPCLSYISFVGLQRRVSRGTHVVGISGLPGDPAQVSAVIVDTAQPVVPGAQFLCSHQDLL